MFYYTMNGIKSRLENSVEVYNPTDTSMPLLTTDKHRTKMNNWKTRAVINVTVCSRPFLRSHGGSAYG